jgi:citrate lyase beta subunit
VPPGEKLLAREKAAGFVSAFPGWAFVWINPVRASTAFTVACGEEDLAGVVHPGLRGIVLPKIEAAADVLELDALMRAWERARGVPCSTLELIGIAETAREGILNLSGSVQCGSPGHSAWRSVPATSRAISASSGPAAKPSASMCVLPW